MTKKSDIMTEDDYHRSQATRLATHAEVVREFPKGLMGVVDVDDLSEQEKYYQGEFDFAPRRIPQIQLR